MTIKIKMRIEPMAPPFDYLDSMAWDIAISAVLLGIAAIRLPYKASSGSVDDGARNLRLGFGAALGASGFYLFITGISLSFTWPFAFSGGVYNILFGGIATLGGLALLATSAALFLNGGLAAVSYFAAIAGLYAVVDAYAMINYGLTSDPTRAALGYLSFAAAAFLSVPATHTNSKALRYLFAVFSFLFAIAWAYQAANFTWGHLRPPPPSA